MNPRDKKTSGQGTKNKADIVAVIGASGTGKSSYIKGELLRKYSRLFVFSPLEKTDRYAEFCGGVITSKITEFIALVRAGTKAIVFVPTGNDASVKRQFDQFCRVVWEIENCHVVVEELGRVTMASWSPPAWKNLSTGGRHQGITLIGVNQRTTIDKDFLGNCTEVRCYRVNYDMDAKTLADSLRLGAEYEAAQGGRAKQVKGYERIRELPDFHYFHKNRDLSVSQGVNKSL